tara:strand:- start:385 stop:1185 length:801 start_codon:yes stop_codon:yes gene_type:complete
MEPKSLSLSKKLDGGYLHVKKRDSNVKQRVSKGGNSKGGNGRGGGYSNYLKRVKGSSCDDKNVGGGQNVVAQKVATQKVVAIKLGGSKKRTRDRSPKKKKVEVKDISESNIVPTKAPAKALAKAPAKAPVKAPAKAPAKVQVKGPVKQPKKGVPIQMPKTKGSLKKGKVVKRGRHSIKHSNKRSLTRRRCHDLKKGKRISVTKTRKLSNKDVQSIQSKLKEIKKKSAEDIKKELDKEGIQVSGKSPSILKDIYMYSKLCGINIKRE